MFIRSPLFYCEQCELLPVFVTIKQNSFCRKLHEITAWMANSCVTCQLVVAVKVKRTEENRNWPHARRKPLTLTGKCRDNVWLRLHLDSICAFVEKRRQMANNVQQARMWALVLVALQWELIGVIYHSGEWMNAGFSIEKTIFAK